MSRPIPAGPEPGMTIAIVGAGFCGALTAVHLLRAPARAGIARVVLFERRTRFGRGLAYSSWDDNLLLNVPAGNMSALPDEPAHFVEYLQSVDPAFNAATFASRRIYGDYLESTLAAAARGAAVLERWSGEVRAVRRGGGASRWMVSLHDGRTLAADRVVLALGHFPPLDPPPRSDFFESESYIANPWNFEALDRTDPAKPVALLGAGHTAVDALFRLTSHSDTRKVLLISRRGLPAQGHRFAPKAPGPSADFPAFLRGIPDTLRAHVRAVRGEARRKLRAGEDWRDVINALRPHTPGIWLRLPLQDRRKFLRRVVPFWDIHRHRVAPAAFLRLEQMLRSGQVEPVRGQVESYERTGAGVELVVRRRGVGGERRLSVGAVVNCTGPNYDIAAIRLPLIAQLRDEGFIAADPLKLGIDIGEDYGVIGRDGIRMDGLHYIGPMLKARFWEAIAVPELRVHAQQLARILAQPDPRAAPGSGTP